ncbi:hypothetical protein HK405_008254 [Cladochytrium tenue]|nr:hypothetical protein HK405_008254 [Cladochytrium tenue]
MTSKVAINNNPKFDFLKDLVAAIPDPSNDPIEGEEGGPSGRGRGRGTSTGTGQATLEGIVPLYFRRLLDASEQDRLPKDVRALTAMPESVVYRVLTSLRYSKGNRSDRSWDQLNRGWDLVLDYVAEDQLSARSARLVAAAAADAGQVGVSTEDNLAFLRKMHKRAATGRYFVEILETLGPGCRRIFTEC